MLPPVFIGVHKICQSVMCHVPYAELSHGELDMVIFNQIMGCINKSSSVSVVSRHHESERVKSYASFLHRGKPVCRQTFLALHGISRKRLDNISKSLKENGLAARVHGNTQRKPKHACPFIFFHRVRCEISINVL